jgi:hypothetical protein
VNEGAILIQVGQVKSGRTGERTGDTSLEEHPPIKIDSREVMRLPAPKPAEWQPLAG